MSSGLAALNSSDYTRARSLLLEARSYRPDSPEVKDALVEVDAAIRLARIRELQGKALSAEKSEEWKQALASYQAVLEVDNSIQFALQGKEYAMMRDRLETRINDYLEKPKRLESDRFLKEAIELIKEAKQIERKGPRCTQQLKKLSELVRLAQIPVSVTIESDSMTEVVVYKVGKLGLFQTKELKLRPGTYTIVGARNGFKDVRKIISVNAEKDPLRITVQCREKI
jgi:tetratricopeptide (TPR) repeat protein